MDDIFGVLRSFDALKNRMLAELYATLDATVPIEAERVILELNVYDLTSIAYNPTLLHTDLICTCLGCNHKWQVPCTSLKVSSLNNLLVYCPECYKPPAALGKIPTLKMLERVTNKQNERRLK